MKLEDDDTQPPSAAAQATKTPAQWADVVFPKDERGARPFQFWQHATAEQLHGWKLHEHHAGKPMALTEAQYRGALEAAAASKLEPHAEALSEHLKREPREPVEADTEEDADKELG